MSQVMNQTKQLATAFISLAVIGTPALAQQAGDGPVKVYLMAGQSNMVGHGNWYQTDGTTQHPGLVDPTDPYPLTQAQVDAYTVPLNQVWVDHPEGRKERGPLEPGFGSREYHIGPELGMGHELAALNTNQFYFFKSDKGGTTLGGNWRPPTAVADRGGSVGEQYTRMIRQFHETLVDFDNKYTPYNGAGYEIAGLVWLQGWNEYFNAGFRAEYRDNMVDFVEDVRRDLGVADLPVIISDAPRNVTAAEHEEIATAKQLAVADINAALPGSAVYVNSLGIDPVEGEAFFPLELHRLELHRDGQAQRDRCPVGDAIHRGEPRGQRGCRRGLGPVPRHEQPGCALRDGRGLGHDRVQHRRRGEHRRRYADQCRGAHGGHRADHKQWRDRRGRRHHPRDQRFRQHQPDLHPRRLDQARPARRRGRRPHHPLHRGRRRQRQRHRLELQRTAQAGRWAVDQLPALRPPPPQ